MSLLFDPLDRDFRKNVQGLQPTPGYCVFVDMVGSTKAKDEGVPKWAATLFNTFSLAASHIGFAPLKTIGDALMFYIGESEMGSGKLISSPLQLFLGLCFIVQEKEAIFGATKIGVAYCTHAYELTFVRGTRDVYGKDIDLTARLLSLAVEGEILMNEGFVERVRRHYKDAGNRSDFPDVAKIAGPWPQLFKGFDDYINIYKLSAGGSSLAKASEVVEE